MEATKPRLGRGLNALMGEVGGTGPVGKLAVGRIHFNPHQPRKRFDDDELQALTQSIKTHGVLQPLWCGPPTTAINSSPANAGSAPPRPRAWPRCRSTSSTSTTSRSSRPPSSRTSSVPT